MKAVMEKRSTIVGGSVASGRYFGQLYKENMLTGVVTVKK